MSNDVSDDVMPEGNSDDQLGEDVGGARPAAKGFAHIMGHGNAHGTGRGADPAGGSGAILETSQPESPDLAHHFLISMPLGQPDAEDIFDRSVVYMFQHNEHGAVGLVVNKPLDLTVDDMFKKVALPLGRPDLKAQIVFQGGPVQTDRGFVLHEPMPVVNYATGDLQGGEPAYMGSLPILTAGATELDGAKRNAHLELTTSRDVLEAMAEGKGPEQVFMTLGCAAWDKGQLEDELAGHFWLAVKAEPRIIFNTPPEQRYTQALSLLGIDPVFLNVQGGVA